jgi:hypothetical protein
MTKCFSCAEENAFESLFCKQCGRCLLSPDPERIQQSVHVRIESPIKPEIIGFYDGLIVKNSIAANLERSAQPATPIIVAGFLLLNILIILLVAKIVLALTG